MSILRPAEFIYLERPFWSEGTEMIKAVLQELCLNRVLEVVIREKIIDKHDTHKRFRLALKTGPNYSVSSSQTDNVVLNLFTNKQELWFNDFRFYLLEALDKDTDKFKKDFIYPDLKNKGLCLTRNILTAEGRKEKNLLRKKLDDIDQRILHPGQEKGSLSAELNELGNNIILLD